MAAKLGFGEFLREARDDRGLSQEALAELLGVTGTTISQWESEARKPGLRYINSLSSALERSPHKLLVLLGVNLTATPAEFRNPRLARLLRGLTDAQEEFLVNFLEQMVGKARDPR